MPDERYEQVGMLINGVEFIPQDIWLSHLPIALPPEDRPTMQAVYVRVNGDDE